MGEKNLMLLHLMHSIFGVPDMMLANHYLQLCTCTWNVSSKASQGKFIMSL